MPKVHFGKRGGAFTLKYGKKKYINKFGAPAGSKMDWSAMDWSAMDAQHRANVADVCVRGLEEDEMCLSERSIDRDIIINKLPDLKKIYGADNFLKLVNYITFTKQYIDDSILLAKNDQERVNKSFDKAPVAVKQQFTDRIDFTIKQFQGYLDELFSYLENTQDFIVNMAYKLATIPGTLRINELQLRMEVTNLIQDWVAGNLPFVKKESGGGIVGLDYFLTNKRNLIKDGLKKIQRLFDTFKKDSNRAYLDTKKTREDLDAMIIASEQRAVREKMEVESRARVEEAQQRRDVQLANEDKARIVQLREKALSDTEKAKNEKAKLKKEKEKKATEKLARDFEAKAALAEREAQRISKQQSLQGAAKVTKATEEASQKAQFLASANRGLPTPDQVKVEEAKKPSEDCIYFNKKTAGSYSIHCTLCECYSSSNKSKESEVPPVDVTGKPGVKAYTHVTVEYKGNSYHYGWKRDSSFVAYFQEIVRNSWAKLTKQETEKIKSYLKNYACKPKVKFGKRGGAFVMRSGKKVYLSNFGMDQGSPRRNEGAKYLRIINGLTQEESNDKLNKYLQAVLPYQINVNLWYQFENIAKAEVPAFPNPNNLFSKYLTLSSKYKLAVFIRWITSSRGLRYYTRHANGTLINTGSKIQEKAVEDYLEGLFSEYRVRTPPGKLTLKNIDN